MKKPTRHLPGWLFQPKDQIIVLHKVSQLRAGNTPNFVFFAGKLPETYDHWFLTDPSLTDRKDHRVHFKILRYAGQPHKPVVFVAISSFGLNLYAISPGPI